jgi:hypothetical protein
MALTWLHKLNKTNDCSVFTFNNITVYGTGGDPLRSDAAEVLLAAHITEEGVEEFATVDSTPYLSKTSYNISNTLDGHYRFEILRFPKWVSGIYDQIEIRDGNNIIITYATLVYGETTNKFYKLINPNTDVEPGVDVGWEIEWEEVTNFTDEEIRNNDTIETVAFNDIHDCRSTVCTKNELYKVSCVDPNCTDLKNYVPYFKRAVLLAGARAKNADSQSEKAETIIRTLSNLCTEC